MKLSHPDLFRQQCHIDGRWVDAADGATLAVVNPADDRPIGTVPRLTAADVRGAVDAANRALPAWRETSAKDRSRLLRRWFDLCMANQGDLAMLLTLEQGKPLA